MDGQENSGEPPPKKRRRRGSLIERAGSFYDFEAVLRARVVMPDGNAAPSQVIDINLSRPATRALAGPRSLGARALELVQGRGSGAAEASVGGAP